MKRYPRYFVVEAEALPEIFRKVAFAKQLLEVGEAHAVNQAVRKAGISRSAFYKYKDSIRPFQDMLNGRIVNFQILLMDEPGVLSAVLNDFAKCGANILTINQSIPTGGSAVVSVGAETASMEMSFEEMLRSIERERGVVRCEVLAG